MRDKLIDIILAANNYKELGVIAEGYASVYAREVAARRAEAERIADALLAAGVVQEWVSVEERLPEKREIAPNVIAYLNNEDGQQVCTGWFSNNMWLLLVDDNDHNIAFGEDAVTHWMPLPAPPKEEK